MKEYLSNHKNFSFRKYFFHANAAENLGSSLQRTATDFTFPSTLTRRFTLLLDRATTK
jgi:hypothetical protein